MYKTLTRFRYFICLLGVPVLFSLSCEVDHGLAPIQTKIMGHVIFDGPPPGSNVAEVRVAATKNFPPQNLTTDVIYSNQLEFSRDPDRTQPDTARFEISAPPGEYQAIGVLWREGGRSWEITNIVGLYTDPAALAPKKVVLSEETPVVDSISIGADWQLAQRNSFIEGEIDFTGEWPEDTEILALAVFPIVPNPDKPLEFLTLQSLDIAIPMFRAEPFQYRTRVPGGTFKFIAVFFKGKSGGLFDVRAIGFHSCPNDSTLPKSVVVPDNATVTGVDIVVDLTSLPGGARYRLDGGECSGS
ncbi:MAG: hypothetical protein ACE5I1_14085 [bacterium]